jgi:radical SAM protein with 4Fe4S-binding SPASM domain
MNGCTPGKARFDFTPERVRRAATNGRLLSIEIEPSLYCNLRCPYCYLTRYPASRDEGMEVKTAIMVMDQARDLGAEKVVLLGGEPLYYPAVMDVVCHAAKRSMAIEIFTNGTALTQELARELFRWRVRVVLKMNSRNAERQDRLAGRKGVAAKIERALGHLAAAGYPRHGRFLAVSTIVCRQNLDEIPSLWRWARHRGIAPYVEMLTPQGTALQNDWLCVDSHAVGCLFQRLSAIDHVEFGYRWEPQPPLAGNACLRHQYSCLVTTNGDVHPCVGMPIRLGNVHASKLAAILRSSQVLDDLKHYRERIKEPCRSCESSDHCYGCRGAAYQLTGDHLAADPLCWKNAETGDAHETTACE